MIRYGLPTRDLVLTAGHCCSTFGPWQMVSPMDAPSRTKNALAKPGPDVLRVGPSPAATELLDSQRVLLRRLFGDGAFELVFGPAEYLFEDSDKVDDAVLVAHLQSTLEQYLDNLKKWSVEIEYDVKAKSEACGGMMER